MTRFKIIISSHINIYIYVNIYHSISCKTRFHLRFTIYMTILWGYLFWSILIIYDRFIIRNSKEDGHNGGKDRTIMMEITMTQKYGDYQAS